MGTSFTKALNPVDASLLIQDGKGKRYDPGVVKAFLSHLDKVNSSKANPGETVLRSGQLLSGMTLSQDLITSSGDILLSKEHTLNEHLIDQIRGFERMDGNQLSVHINSKK
jgi:hypothetical protein